MLSYLKKLFSLKADSSNVTNYELLSEEKERLQQKLHQLKEIESELNEIKGTNPKIK